uniref:Senescence domain-containing protein n=1 Tax=Physcomitrium patens TaxID=3218 RepID=A0A2K1JIP3_PHYPA|nr:hypothetical protein PHYPA_018828 [Physcomitrium patens]
MSSAKLFDALEAAGYDVAAQTKMFTQDVVAHRYGEQAVVTRDTLSTTEHPYLNNGVNYTVNAATSRSSQSCIPAPAGSTLEAREIVQIQSLCPDSGSVAATLHTTVLIDNKNKTLYLIIMIYLCHLFYDKKLPKVFVVNRKLALILSIWK